MRYCSDSTSAVTELLQIHLFTIIAKYVFKAF